jgi:alpha-glucosidase (family GH31 glycosyl hydrolase)
MNVKCSLLIQVLELYFQILKNFSFFFLDKWDGIDVYFKSLIEQGMKTIILFDPFLIVNETNYEPFKRGKEKNVFITWPKDVTNPDYEYTNSSIMVGFCWPKGRVAYPDFFKNSTKEWWVNEILEHRKKLIFNGLWVG